MLCGLVLAMMLTACASGGGDRPAGDDHAKRFSDSRAQEVFDKVRDNVATLVAKGSDGSVFVLEPAEPDLLRVMDAALALQGEDGDAVIRILSAHRDQLLRAHDEDGRHGLWQTARWLTEAPPNAGRLFDAQSRKSLIKTLDTDLAGVHVNDPARSTDSALSEYHLLVETASLLNLHDVTTKGTAQLRTRPEQWCSALSSSLAKFDWQRAAAISALLRDAAQQCRPTVPGGQFSERLSGDPTAHMGAGNASFSAVEDAVDMAEIRRYLGRSKVSAKGCASLLKTRAAESILPNIPESLIERCVQISKVTGGRMEMSQDIRRLLHRTINTDGSLPTSLQGDSWSVAFQWDLLRHLGYPRPIADATWRALIRTGAGTDYQSDLLLRDAILSPSRVTPARVDALTGRSSGEGGETLAVAAFVSKTHACNPRWLSWLRKVSGDAPKRADFDLLSYATAVSAQRECGLREDADMKAAAGVINKVTQIDTVAGNEYAFSEEWIKVESRCLAGISTARSRLWHDVDVALRPGFINVRLPARVHYAAVRMAEIADQGCTKGWWG